MGYPRWEELARTAVELTNGEASKDAGVRAGQALGARNYPAVFQIAFDTLGPDRTLEVLRSALAPTKATGAIYELLARWPIAVYLTTNFDNEIPRHLAKLGQAYETYSNGPHHMGLLVSDLHGAVVRLHGDLTSPEGLVLTSSQYAALATGDHFQYWRTRMTSVFQMQQVVVIGYSLSDPHVRAVLEAAKIGAPATHAVCWLSPHTTTAQAAEYSEKYRIRVIPYPATDDHSGLLRTVQTISRFIIPREGVTVRRSIAEVVAEGRTGDPAATAVYVFNRLVPHVDLGAASTRCGCRSRRVRSPALRRRGQFSIGDVLDENWVADRGARRRVLESS